MSETSTAPAPLDETGRDTRRHARLPGRRGMIVGALALLVFALARLIPTATEAVYGRLVYPRIAFVLARATQWVPVSLAEWVFVTIAVHLVLAIPQGMRRARRDGERWSRSALMGAATLGGRAGAWWAVFVLLWGLNYARPLPDRWFGLGRTPAPPRAAELLDTLGLRLDDVRSKVREDAAGITRTPDEYRELDDHLRRLQVEALQETGFPAVDGGAVKRLFWSPLALRWGVSGVYGPFTGEPNIVWPAGPALLPFTMAHERAHLSGFAQEEDASFVALLTCWRSDRPEVRYAAWLALFVELRRDPRPRAAGVKRDLLALASFVNRHRGPEASVVWSGYSEYLKLHGVRGGIKSYGRVGGLALRWLDRNGFPPEPRGTGSDAPSPTGAP